MTQPFSFMILSWFINPILEKITEMEKKIMSQLDDLKAANEALKSAISALASDQKSAFERLEALIASGASSQDIQTVIDDLKASTQKLADLDTAAQNEGATPPPPAA